MRPEDYLDSEVPRGHPPRRQKKAKPKRHKHEWIQIQKQGEFDEFYWQGEWHSLVRHSNIWECSICKKKKYKQDKAAYRRATSNPFKKGSPQRGKPWSWKIRWAEMQRQRAQEKKNRLA